MLINVVKFIKQVQNTFATKAALSTLPCEFFNLITQPRKRSTGHPIERLRATDGRAVSFKPEIGIRAQRDSINRRQIFNYKRKPSALALHRLRATREDGVHSRQPFPSACTRFPLTPLNARLRDTDKKIRRLVPAGQAQFLFLLFAGSRINSNLRVRERSHKT